MIFKKISKCLFFLFLTVNLTLFFGNSYGNERVCDNDLINYIYKFHDDNFNYQESREDVGIFFDFKWDKIKKKILIKRNENNYPLIRYSLFETENLIPGKSAIKKINLKDLSKLSDERLNQLTYIKGKVDLELVNGKKISINSKRYKFNNFNLSDFEILSIQNIDTSKGILEISFKSLFANQRNDLTNLLKNNKYLDDNIHVICKDIRDYLTWPLTSVELDEFKYDSDIREGLKNKEIIINPIFELTYDAGSIRTLRTEKGVGFFRQSFDFKNFPFDTQKLLIRIKSGVGNYINKNLENGDDIGSVTLITPEPGPYLNLEKFLDPEINKLKAWKIEDDIKIVSKVLYENSYDVFTKEIVKRNENVLDIEITIQRNFQHYLLKIMLPVFLILSVAWFVLWIPTEKYEARLNTSIIALLALIAYNFVFQDDIPKLEYLTDLDWFILYSYIFCCIPVFLSIAFSKFVSKNQKKVAKINRLIKIWGIFLYFIINGQIFFFN